MKKHCLGYIRRRKGGREANPEEKLEGGGGNDENIFEITK